MIPKSDSFLCAVPLPLLAAATSVVDSSSASAIMAAHELTDPALDQIMLLCNGYNMISAHYLYL